MKVWELEGCSNTELEYEHSSIPVVAFIVNSLSLFMSLEIHDMFQCLFLAPLKRDEYSHA